MVEDYQAARQRDEDKRDEETIGYPTENWNYHADTPLVTFRSWLEQLAGTHSYSRDLPQPEER